MFSVIAVVVWLVFGSLLTLLAWRQMRSSYERILCYFFAIIFYIIALSWFSFKTAGSYSNQLSDFTSIKQIHKQIDLDAERRDKLISVLKIELSKYPEIEKEVIMSIKPDMMLLAQFPNLKSNETIANMVNQIIHLENSVYEKRFYLIDLQRQIYYREISPWVISSVITYANFFKEENPFAR